ncbi:MAG: hypothetical protein ACNYNX_03200 [Leucobacter sp.]
MHEQENRLEPSADPGEGAWESEVAQFPHGYQPTPETLARRSYELRPEERFLEDTLPLHSYRAERL